MLSQHHLRLILQVLHLFWIFQTTSLCGEEETPTLATQIQTAVSLFTVTAHHNPVGLTWLEEHDGLEAGELCGIDSEGLEAAEDLLQEAQVQAGVAVFSLHAGAEVGQGEKRAAVQRQGPLDGAEQEELAPRLLQQDHLARRSFSMRPKV